MLTHRERKVRMFLEQGGLCCYCSQPMYLTFHQFIGPEKISSRVATIEHLDDKFSEERGKHKGERRRLLACHKCNQNRGRDRCAENAHEHRARSVAGTRKRNQYVEAGVGPADNLAHAGVHLGRGQEAVREVQASRAGRHDDDVPGGG